MRHTRKGLLGGIAVNALFAVLWFMQLGLAQALSYSIVMVVWYVWLGANGLFLALLLHRASKRLQKFMGRKRQLTGVAIGQNSVPSQQPAAPPGAAELRLAHIVSTARRIGVVLAVCMLCMGVSSVALVSQVLGLYWLPSLGAVLCKVRGCRG